MANAMRDEDVTVAQLQAWIAEGYQNARAIRPGAIREQSDQQIQELAFILWRRWCQPRLTPHNEVAEQCGLSVERVRSLEVRALRMLRSATIRNSPCFDGISDTRLGRAIYGDHAPPPNPTKLP